jgi:adhesin transport system outer membrane protein
MRVNFFDKCLRFSALAAGIFAFSPAFALTLEDTILYVIETNPEIKAAAANKQAIEFELDQAHSFWAPRFELEGRAGYSYNDGTTTSDLPAADDPIAGYELRSRIIQRLFDGGSTRSEIERQAYRVDAAALRVLERAEFLSLEATRAYAEVIRNRELETLARRNHDYHKEVFTRIEQAYENGVVGIADLQQAEERVFLAEDTVTQFKYNTVDAETLFLETVGVAPDNLGRVPPLVSGLPTNLDAALGIARQSNPTLRFLQSDVGTADALSREVSANRLPTLDLEAGGRTGEDVKGFEGKVLDAEVGLVLRYEFQGNQKRALRQEHIRRASESRATLLRQARLVEREVRQSWANLESTKNRIRIIQRQAELARDLRASYEKEFEVGSRSLLDILNTQGALFQAEANLINVRSLEVFINYRLLAAIGVLLPTLGIEPPEDAATYARDFNNAPDVAPAPEGTMTDAASFRNWRKSLNR